MKINNKICIIIILLMSSNQITIAQEDRPLNINSLQSKAIASSIDQFRKEGHNIQEYRIVIKDKRDLTEVIFVPNSPKNDPYYEKPKNAPEIHYFVDNTNGTIVRQLFGK